MKKISDAGYALELAHATGVPAILWGAPGVGKTAAVEQAAAKRGLYLETLIAAWREPGDILGYQVPAQKDGYLVLAVPGWVERLLQAGDKASLFLDELSCAPPSVQAALLRLVHERVAAETRLPRYMPIVAAANPTDLAAGGYDLAPAMSTRYIHLQYEPDARGWAAHFPNYWGHPPVLPGITEEIWAPWREAIAAFILRRPDLLLKVPATEAERALPWPCPRTWDAASRVIAFTGKPDVDLIASCVGDGAGTEAAAYLADLDLPDPEDLLAEPANLKLPKDRGDIVYATLVGVARAAISNLTGPRWLAAWTIIAEATRQGHGDIACTAAADLAAARKPGLPALTKDVIATIKPVLQAAGLM